MEEGCRSASPEDLADRERDLEANGAAGRLAAVARGLDRCPACCDRHGEPEAAFLGANGDPVVNKGAWTRTLPVAKSGSWLTTGPHAMSARRTG